MNKVLLSHSSLLGLFLGLAFFFFIIFMLVVCPPSGFCATPEPSEVIFLRDYPVRIEFQKKDRKVADWVESICASSILGLSRQIGLDHLEPINIILVPQAKGFENKSGADLPDWGAAFAFMERQVMLVDVEKAISSWNALEKTIPHELSHLLLSQKVGPIPMPMWFLEGLALWQAHEWSLLDNWHLMNAVWSGKVIPLAHITASFPADARKARTAYRISYMAFVDLFKDIPVDEVLPAFLSEVVGRGDFAQALEIYRGESLHQFSSRFKEELEDRYTSPLLIFQTGPLFSILAVMFLFVVLGVKLRNRRKLKLLEMRERGWE